MKFLCVCNFFPVVTAMSLASPLWHSSSGGIFHFTTKFSLEVHLFLNFQAESATAALNCSGVILGSLPIRVSPSKTPVRPRAPRPMMN
ncbi:unnamed protein product [Triticum turgidum subsp. durum]|uniref:Secreted protein n=1 Tax=Triticum turgidum subsp. durum TaxID=4567 RepID=A0A9R0ZGA9_TRITD|nr:unnamed protein product [Triticum turgidum subsp. durum]